MRLVSGQPFWSSQSSVTPAPTLDTDAKTDVVIVGAGITGALVAHALTMAGVDTIAVDQRTGGSASSSASTALLLYDLDTSLRELAQKIGEASAGRIYRLGVDAIDCLSMLTSECARDVGDDCGFERRPSLYLASHPVAARALHEEANLRRRHGIALELLSRREIAEQYPFSAAGAIRSADAAHVDPLRLTRALLQRAAIRGLRLYEQTTVAGYEPTGLGVRVQCAHGPIITARHIVFATGYEALPYITGLPFTRELTRLRTTYAVASAPLGAHTLEQHGWRDRCLIWETARPYLYLRTTPEGHVLIGGEDDAAIDRTTQLAHLPRAAGRLTERFSRLFPDIPLDIEATWSGLFESSLDGLPYIGAHPRYPRAWFALGYGGNGITFAVMAADILCDLLRGRPNANAALFRFGR